MGKITLKINTYNVLEHAIEEGLKLGFNRAHKHTDSPTEEDLLEHQRRAIMECLEEVVKF